MAKGDGVRLGYGVVLRETKPGKLNEGALLVALSDGGEQWFPKKGIHDDSDLYADGHSGELVIEAWLAQSRGLG